MVISMERWRGKVAVVTGANAGIGAAIVEQLVNAGLQVAGIARRKEKTEALAAKLAAKPGKLHAVQADMTKENEIVAAFEWVKKNLGPVHVLVNNAGVFVMSSLTEGETELWRKVLDTNVMGLCIATREAVKQMRESKIEGHIVHINSMAGHSVTSFEMNMYPASKHAVTALTETLRQELNAIGTKIKVTSVSPGFVSTDIIGASASASGIPVTDHWSNFEKNTPYLDPTDVADAVIYALSTPPHVQIHELKLRSFRR